MRYIKLKNLTDAHNQYEVLMDVVKTLPFLMIWDTWHKTKNPRAAAGLGPNGLTCHSLHLHFILPILVSGFCCSLGLACSVFPCISPQKTNPEIIILYSYTYPALLYSQGDGLCLGGWALGHGAQPTVGDTASSAHAARSASRHFASCATSPACTCTPPWW